MARVARARARHRRSFLAFAGLCLLVAGALLWTRDARTPPAQVGASPSPTTAHESPAQPTVEPIPAWLAWVPGGFPPNFRERIDDAPALLEVIVVAGDTRWMSASHDTDGNVVDRPHAPYRIPIDAFAVDPDEYGPFLPDGTRDAVVKALRDGEAVLGASSAELRRLGVGGVMSFGDQQVRVGAVAPDEVVGWSEMLVSRSTGTRLGITTDRYLLALAPPQQTLRGFEGTVRSLLPADSYLRVVEPGGTRYVRVASGVNPPIVMKKAFGEFPAYPRADDPAYLNVSPRWRDKNIQTRTVPILGEVTCNVAFFPALEGALQELVDRGLDDLINIYSGCYAARTVARSETAPPSQHAYGAAIDIDAPTNGYGDTTPAMDSRVVDVFEDWGFIWGGNFLVPDGMHFEFGAPVAA